MIILLKPANSNCLAILLVVSIIFLSTFIPLREDAFAESPSFSRQEAKDSSNDWDLENKKGCEYARKLTNQYPDISSVSYMSDGKNLNVSYWLADNFKQPPLTKFLRQFTGLVGIIVESLSDQKIREDEYVTNQIFSLKDIQGFNLIGVEETTIAGNFATKIIFNHTYKDAQDPFFYNFTSMEILTVKDNKVYTIFYLANVNKYHEYLPRVQDMINSMEIEDKKEPSDMDIKIKNPPDWLRVPTDIDDPNPNIVLFLPIFNGYPFYSISYYMLIDIPTIYDEKQKYEYMFEVIYNNIFQSWTGQLRESSFNNVDRILESVNNYTVHFDRDKKSINLVLNLSTLGYPNEYTIVFAASHRLYNYQCVIVDVTNAFQVPPAEFDISYSQSSLDLRPGDEKIVEIKIESSDKSRSATAVLSTDEINGIKLNFNPPSIEIPPNGAATSNLIIKITNATIRPYTIPIHTKITFPDSARFIESGAEVKSYYTEVVDNTFTNLTINVLGELKVSERFDAFWKVYGGLVSFVGAGFAAGFSAYVVDGLKNRKKRKSVGTYDY